MILTQDPKINLNEGVYLIYDAVMKIGNSSYTRIKNKEDDEN